MDSYIDIEIKPDAEMQDHVLLGIVYTKLHKALVNLKTDTIGVSFPRYELKLGSLLRIHGNRGLLDELMNLNWLGGLIGYCQISKIQTVPDKTQYRILSRKQCTMTQSKLKRLIKRGSISPEEIKKYREKMFSKSLDNPYVELQSGSNGHKHRRYIAFSELLDESVTGKFDTFGLSDKGTIPWF